jgi:hypothetical protein
LPASPEVGDQIVLADYARTWATNAVTIDSNGNNFQGEADTYTVDYDTVGQSLNIVYADSTKGWLPVSDDAVALVPSIGKGIFAYGNSGSVTNLSNLVSGSGVVATDTTGVGTARQTLGGARYGTDKGIFAYGDSAGGATAVSNLVSNSGVIASDTSGVGTARKGLAAAGYGNDKAIFGFGENTLSMTNLVNNSGVIGSDVTGVGTGRGTLAATTYGTDKAIFGFGHPNGSALSMTNLVSSSGVVASDTSGVGTVRSALAAAEYGGDKAIFAYGNSGGNASQTKLSSKSLVNNSGVVAADVTGVGTARDSLAAVGYGGDKAIFGYGNSGSPGSLTLVSLTNLISNSGVVAADVTGVGTARRHLSASGYSA